jgi:hypothetical protein
MKCKLCDECFDTKYRIPRNLTCGHCYCEQCLKIYQKNEEIECPNCTKKSPSKLPICYAIFDLIEKEDNKKKEFCSLHQLEKIQFHCKSDNEDICSTCLLIYHNGHNITSLRESAISINIKKDYGKLYESIFQKNHILKCIKTEIEKYEEFLSKMFEKQKSKIFEISSNFITKKKERLEELNKMIELNYLNQHEVLNKILLETEHKKNYIDIYSSKISELLENFRK